MIRYCGVCFLALLLSGWLLADESFYVIAPDQKNQQLLSVSVTATPEGITTHVGEPLKLPFGPSSIALNPDGKRLVVSSGSSSAKDGSPVATVEMLEGGKLRLGQTSSLEQPTGYTSVDRRGRFFLFANYRTGSIGVYRISKDGRVGEQVCSLKTPRAEAHCILTTPDNRFTYVPCVKTNNALYQFAFDQQTGQLKPLEPFNASPPAMFGPRHVAYHPSLPIAYFSNEQQLGVSVFEIGSDGQLTARQHAVSMPRRSPYVKGERGMHASDLIVTPDGKRLFVAVRDFVADEDSVFTFRVESDGRLSQIGRTKVGDIPWKLDLSPDGKYLLVSESADSRLSIYRIDSGGTLSPAAQVNWDAGVRDMVVVDLNPADDRP